MSQDSHGQWVVSIQAVLLVEQRVLHLQLTAAQVIDAAALFQKVHLQQQATSALDFLLWPQSHVSKLRDVAL